MYEMNGGNSSVDGIDQSGSLFDKFYCKKNHLETTPKASEFPSGLVTSRSVKSQNIVMNVMGVEDLSVCKQEKVDDSSAAERTDIKDIEFSAAQFASAEVIIKPDPDEIVMMLVPFCKRDADIKNESSAEESFHCESHPGKFRNQQSPYETVANCENSSPALVSVQTFAASTSDTMITLHRDDFEGRVLRPSSLSDANKENVLQNRCSPFADEAVSKNSCVLKEETVEVSSGEEGRRILGRVYETNELISRVDGVDQSESFYDKFQRKKNHLETTAKMSRFSSGLVASGTVKSQYDVVNVMSVEDMSACKKEIVDDFCTAEGSDIKDIEFSPAQFTTSEVIVKPDPDEIVMMLVPFCERDAVIKNESSAEESLQCESHPDEFCNQQGPYETAANCENSSFDFGLGRRIEVKNDAVHVDGSRVMSDCKREVVGNPTSIEGMDCKDFEPSAVQCLSMGVILKPDQDGPEASFIEACTLPRVQTEYVYRDSVGNMSTTIDSPSETIQRDLSSFIKSEPASMSVENLDDSSDINGGTGSNEPYTPNSSHHSSMESKVNLNLLANSHSGFVSKLVSKKRPKGKTEEHVYSCAHCTAAFSSKSNLKKHIKTHFHEKPFECTECCRKFSDQSNLKKHLRLHTGEKPFGCTFCLKKYSDKSNLNKHIRAHTGEKPFECNRCGAKFQIKNSLIVHERTHTGEKPFLCSYCGAIFASKKTLVSHHTTHTGEKRFKCIYCSAKFSSSSYLTIHVRTHTGEKPFSCSHCNSKFSSHKYLKNHSRRHAGERPHGCIICGAKYATKSSLDDHIRTHTGERPFDCPHCVKTFSNKKNLRGHLKRRHDATSSTIGAAPI